MFIVFQIPFVVVMTLDKGTCQANYEIVMPSLPVDITGT